MPAVRDVEGAIHRACLPTCCTPRDVDTLLPRAVPPGLRLIHRGRGEKLEIAKWRPRRLGRGLCLG